MSRPTLTRLVAHHPSASTSVHIITGLSNQLSNKRYISIMQVFVGSRAYEVDAATSVETLMYQIENTQFLPFDSFALKSSSSGKILELDDALEADEELELTLQVPGGMRKKWKKKRMRRLRRKRRKMRQRAR